jgi:signal transduction histidine kinase
MVDAIRSEQKRITENVREVLFEDSESDDAKKLFDGLPIKRFLAVPIIFARKPIGVMLFGITKTMKEITHAEREIMSELSSVVALAIERAQIYTDLKSANKRLREIDKLKDEFISITSHELRTPMTAIKGYLWLALNEPGQKLNATLKHNLEVCLGSSERLLQLVSEMLTVSRIQSKRFVLNAAPFDILGLLQSTFDELSIVAKEKGIEFVMSKSPGNLKHCTISADKDKIREIFHNLMGNALKFTSEKGRIQVSFIEGKGHISFSVSDTGPGIMKKDMQKLFTKFGKFEHAYKKIPSTAGSGLGLYICKKIIDLHKGEIEVQSVVDKGTTFTVTLPTK